VAVVVTAAALVVGAAVAVVADVAAARRAGDAAGATGGLAVLTEPPKIPIWPVVVPVAVSPPPGNGIFQFASGATYCVDMAALVELLMSPALLVGTKSAPDPPLCTN
jgi:hypothetical protein